MHIPDGFLDTKTALATAAVSAIGLGMALRQVRRRFPKNRVPLIGLSAAFIFSAQMLNFPVAGGTSGHLIGGVLAAVLLGPNAAVLVMSSVIILQCLLFADGGITALGANIFNMAILTPVAGYGIYRAVLRGAGTTRRIRLAASAFSAWCATVAASVSCAGQLALSGTIRWNVAFPAMALAHMLIGVGEALITTLIVFALTRTRPKWLDESQQSNLRASTGELVGYGLIVCAGLILFVAPFACSWPDGLERIAAKLGFEHQAAQQPLFDAPLPDYALPGLSSPVESTIIAGIVGSMVCFGLAFLLAWRLTAREDRIPENSLK